MRAAREVARVRNYGQLSLRERKEGDRNLIVGNCRREKKTPDGGGKYIVYSFFPPFRPPNRMEGTEDA